MEKDEECCKTKVQFWTSTRFEVIVLLFFGLFCAFAMRVNINVSIVCMVNHTAIETQQSENRSVMAKCNQNSDSIKDDKKDGHLVWDKTVQGHVLGAFFWPYAIFQIPCSMLIRKYGARRIFGYSIILSGIITALTPELSRISYIATIVLRAALGILQTSTFPSCQDMLGRWAPPNERGRLSSMCYAGVEIGKVVTYAGAGFLCRYGFDGGWPSIFYISGAISLVWGVVWMILVSDTPDQSRRISVAENKYIERKMSVEIPSTSMQKVNIPWKTILTSLPIYAIIVASFTCDWSVYFLGTFVSTYIDDIFGLDIELNGMFTALTSVFHFIITIFSGWISDFLQRRCLSRGTSRKLFNTIATVIPSVLLVILGYVNCSSLVTGITLLIATMALKGFRYSGFIVNTLDVAPYHAGLIYGIANSVGAIGGYLSTVMASNITKHSTIEEWRTCFYITAVIDICGAVFYIFFSSSDIQVWNDSTNVVVPVTVININNYECNIKANASEDIHM